MRAPTQPTSRNYPLPKGAFALAVLLLLITMTATALACSTQSYDSEGSLKLVPADVSKLSMWNVDTITSGTLPKKTQEEFEGTWQHHLGDEFGVHIDDVDGIVQAQSKDGDLLIVSGVLDKGDIRDKLEDRSFSEETYREYELWSNSGNAVAILSEADSDTEYALIGATEPVRNVLKDLSRNSGSLMRAEDSLTRKVLGRVGKGWYVSTFDSCEEFRGCKAYAVSVSDSREEFLVDIRFAFLFRNERAADSAASDVEDEIYDRYEVVDLKLKVEGEFVIIHSSVDEDDSPY